jgi:hypothetical protein
VYLLCDKYTCTRYIVHAHTITCLFGCVCLLSMQVANDIMNAKTLILTFTYHVPEHVYVSIDLRVVTSLTYSIEQYLNSQKCHLQSLYTSCQRVQHAWLNRVIMTYYVPHGSSCSWDGECMCTIEHSILLYNCVLLYTNLCR